MRTGVNPEKYKDHKNLLKYHRVIIPVYIPNFTEEYYKDIMQVFEDCLRSLFSSINPIFTAVTIINNNSHPNVGQIIYKFIQEGKIDKYIEHIENKGKVYAAINEARASFEPFITIADADVLFFPGWENEVFKIFQAHKKTGVVSPVPSQSLALYKNASLFFDKYFTGNIKYGKIVSDEDCQLFLKGLGNPDLLTRNNAQFSWKEKQYYLEDPVPAVIGANHYVATYRREVLVYNSNFPLEKFKKGYEEKYLDEPADKLGLYRLSSPKTFAYHVGNKPDEVTAKTDLNGSHLINPEMFQNLSVPGRSYVPYKLKEYFFKGLRKIKQL